MVHNLVVTNWPIGLRSDHPHDTDCSGVDSSGSAVERRSGRSFTKKKKIKPITNKFEYWYLKL